MADESEEVQRKKLTDTVAKNAKPGEKQYIVWDSEVKRLGLRVLPGGTKTYVVRIRVGRGKAGRQRWKRIGQHGDGWNADKARIEAERLVGLHASGIDIFKELEPDKLPTVAELVKRFLEHKRGRVKASSLETYEFNSRHVVKALGELKITEMRRADVMKLHESMRETPIVANRVRGLIYALCKYAEDLDYRTQGTNPATGIPPYPQPERERFLDEEEVRRLGEVLREAETGGESRWVIDGFRLLLLTGARCSEIFRAKWDEVDLERAVLRPSDAKTRRRVVPLSTPAIEILKRLPKVSGNPYLIPGWLRGKPYQGEKKTWARLRQKAGLDDVHIHDLRHTFGSTGVSQGLSLRLIGAVLGHTQPATTQRYAHAAPAAGQAASEEISAQLAEWLGPTPPEGKPNVVPFRRRKTARE